MGSGSSQDSKIATQSLEKTIRETKAKEKASTKYTPFTEEEVQRLEKRFKALDTDKDGKIDLQEFRNYAEIRTHFFRERIFAIAEKTLKKQNTAVFDFDQFVNFLKPFNPASAKDSKYEFLFQIYDIDEVVMDIIT